MEIINYNMSKLCVLECLVFICIYNIYILRVFFGLRFDFKIFWRFLVVFMFIVSVCEVLVILVLGLSVLIVDMILFVFCIVIFFVKLEDGVVCYGRSYYLIKMICRFGVL